MEDLPYMPLWVDDWVSDPDVINMKPMEEFCYLRLCIFCWKKRGKLRNDTAYLAGLCKLQKSRFEPIWKKIVQKFVLAQDTFLHNPKIDELLAKYTERHDRLSLNAKKGNEIRWHKVSPGDHKGIASSESESESESSRDKSSSESVPVARDLFTPVVVAVPPKTAKQPHSIPDDLKDLPLFAKDEKLCAVWGDRRESWIKAYVDIDVMQEIRKAHAFQVAHNIVRRRQERAIVTWLNRARPTRGGGAVAHARSEKEIIEGMFS